MEPISSNFHFVVICITAIAFIVTPQLIPNDWERNTSGLLSGIDIYSNRSNVYPPWDLILLSPYRLIGASGSRILSVLIIGVFSHKQKWNLSIFFSIILSPFFIWTMMLSNIDVIALVLPVIVWDISQDKPWMWLGRSTSFLLLLIKPQIGIGMILFLIISNRSKIKSLIVPGMIIMLVTIPISLLGNPPLLIQWFYNSIVMPSKENIMFWSINNVSLTAKIGFLNTVLILFGIGLFFYGYFGFRDIEWSDNRKYFLALFVPMLIGPYASNQGMIAPFAMTPTWRFTITQYIVLFTSAYLNIFLGNSAYFALLLGFLSLLYFQPDCN